MTRLLKVALDAQTNAHELERVGQADSSEVLNAEIAAEQAKVEFVNAQRMFLATFTQLATYSAQSSLEPQPLTGSLVEPPELDPEGDGRYRYAGKPSREAGASQRRRCRGSCQICTARESAKSQPQSGRVVLR